MKFLKNLFRKIPGPTLVGLAIGAIYIGASAVYADPVPAAPAAADPSIKFKVGDPVAPVPPAITARPISLPKNLVGVVTPEEFGRYMAYQEKLRATPEVKELNDKIMVHVKELQKLQAELNKARADALAVDPDMKAIDGKIQSALRTAQMAQQNAAPPKKS